MPRGGKRPGSGRKKGSQNLLTVKTREALWDYIAQQSTPETSCNPFIRAVQLLRDADDPALVLKCIDFLGDRLLPKLKAVEHQLETETRELLITRYTEARRNGHDHAPASF